MSGFSEEVHLRNKVSRAFGSARNASPEKRREVSGELLKCLQSNYQSVRTAASRQLALLFKHMGEMQEQAIDTILDLCEDPETSVRMIGYKLLMDTARREPAWAPRNTDVLVQLLQNEDPLELQTIQNSLFEIIKDLPAKSLPILVEYLVGDGAEHTTELRDHVITFLTGRSSHEIIPILLQDGAGAQLIEGLVKVLSGASATNAQLIVDKLLHPFFRERPHPKLAHNAVRSILHNVESPRRNSDGEVQQLDGDQLVASCFPRTFPYLEIEYQ
ncbi:uncharacterized protein EI90DRAFT_2176421 [Cantharellus anzutake]|uniref:uncharacterized protein n=1 Tax=Cantharellus anzutake TaxID=1750568 RepID=UPI0019057E08|nr:uncharacterized protein EI90DRAFT_2176421 [Cantharellus anzutake]KAF8325196.1 hypothetical protein EI90DRAFT_2176421 [Cantharellus anzutake]